MFRVHLPCNYTVFRVERKCYDIRIFEILRMLNIVGTNYINKTRPTINDIV